jgi:hypothetical protein
MAGQPVTKKIALVPKIERSLREAGEPAARVLEREYPDLSSRSGSVTNGVAVFGRPTGATRDQLPTLAAVDAALTNRRSA